MPFPIGAIFSGDPMGAYQKGKTGALDDQYSALAGKALQDMFQSQVPGAQPVPGAPIQGVQPVQGLGQGGPGGPQMAGGGPGQPPAPGGAGGGPQAGGGPGGGGNAFGPGTTVTGVEVDGKPTQGPPIGGGGGGMTGGALTQGPQVQTQSFQRPPVTQAGGQQQPGGQQQQQGGQQQQQLGQGPLTLQQAVQSIVKAAGPRANPQVVMGALQKMLPALNAQGIQQYREMSLGIREQGVMNAQQRMQAQQDHYDKLEEDKKAAAKQKQENFERKDKEHVEQQQRIDRTAQDAMRTRNQADLDRAVSQQDRLFSERINAYSNAGLPFPPAEQKAMLDKRDQLRAAADEMRRQQRPTTPAAGGAPAAPATSQPQKPVRNLVE